MTFVRYSPTFAKKKSKRYLFKKIEKNATRSFGIYSSRENHQNASALGKAIRDTTKRRRNARHETICRTFPSEYTHLSDDRKVKEARAF